MDTPLVHVVRDRLGLPIVSTAAVAGMTAAFVKAIERFAETEGVDVVTFRKGQRKDDGAKEYLARSGFREGVLFIAKAQEKARVFRTVRSPYCRRGVCSVACPPASVTPICAHPSHPCWASTRPTTVPAK